jgi:tripartite-type tricarboxylate transporter receptor subunit TctC
MDRIDRRAFCAFALSLPLAARAQPGDGAPRGLQLVVPTPPGSQPDLIARWLAEPLAQRAGAPVPVLNRPGAAGAIAVDAVLAAPPESGTLLLAGLDHVAYSHVGNARRPLDPLVDFAPVGAVNRDSWLLACGAAQPFDSPAALAAASRRDGALVYASVGEGTTAHLLSARLCRALGIEATHVPYKDPWLPDLIAGRVHFVVAPTPALIGQVRGGRVRALAALADARLPQLPEVPSIAELGAPDQAFVGGLWLFAPASLAAQAPKLNGWLREAQQRPEIVQRYRDAAIEPAPLDLAQTRAAIGERMATVDAMRLAVFGRAR